MEKLDIHGSIKSVAQIQVTTFIRESYLCRRYFVLIIHGGGKQVLRIATHEILKTSQYVERFELAPPNLGGAGATLVYMKKRGMDV